MQLSLFSVSYAGYWGQQSLDLPAFIAKAGELGYDAVMLAGKRPHLSPLDADEESLATIKASLQKHQVACSVIAGYTDLSPTAAAEVPYLEMQMAYVETLARLAADLGSSIVRVFTAYETDNHAPAAIWPNVVSTLREMCDRAAAYDVTIAIQNHHDIALHTDAMLELLADIARDNCGLGFDAWSPALRGEDLYESARKAAPHTVITTNADFVRFPRYRYHPAVVNYTREKPDQVRAVPFGEGFIDYEAFFAGLKDGGFNGTANYEMCSPIRGGGDIQNLDRYATTYIEWMRKSGFVK
ncbi:MAG: sugar phosphate isomerase/epimerase [Planctomycetaceae bacterium]|nr:sugar phosphate isomerase/epimerase [Planctomycetaceae bacterium]